MINWLKCLWRGHDWAIVNVRHFEGVFDQGPVLFEMPASYYTLGCRCCLRSEEHEECEWFNQHDVSVWKLEWFK